MEPSAGVPARVALFHGWADSPVWYRTPGDFGPVDLTTLPISPDLHRRLTAWNSSAGAILSANDLEWPSPAVQAEFTAAGSRLAEELRRELGIEVEYTTDGDDDGPAAPGGPPADDGGTAAAPADDDGTAAAPPSDRASGAEHRPPPGPPPGP